MPIDTGFSRDVAEKDDIYAAGGARLQATEILLAGLSAQQGMLAAILASAPAMPTPENKDRRPR